MKTFKSFLTESKLLTIYHGDNHKTTKLDPALMNQGNNQVGIGIYFGSLEIAKTYGKDIISIDINPKDFEDGHDYASDILNKKSAVAMMDYIQKNSKRFQILFDDYGVDNNDELYDMLAEDELRNFQLGLVEYSDTKTVVKAWNKFIKIDGLYEKSSGFYSVINPKYKVTQVKAGK